MINLSGIIRTGQVFIQKHSPEILTGIGIAGFVSTAVLAVKATPRALELIEEKKQEEHVDSLTPVETIKATWKCYIPTVISGVTSATCLIGANNIHARRNAALATAYTISESAFKEYKDKVKSALGEKKDQQVVDAIAKDRLEKDPISNKEVVVTGKGEVLCYDSLSGRYFKSDIEKIRKAVNEVNRSLIHDGYISLNYFYSEIGLTNTETGYIIGWHIDRGLMDVRFSSQLAEDGTPCLVLDYTVQPKYDYDKWF